MHQKVTYFNGFASLVCSHLLLKTRKNHSHIKIKAYWCVSLAVYYKSYNILIFLTLTNLFSEEILSYGFISVIGGGICVWSHCFCSCCCCRTEEEHCELLSSSVSSFIPFFLLISGFLVRLLLCSSLIKSYYKFSSKYLFVIGLPRSS